jgi:alpha-amylase
VHQPYRLRKYDFREIGKHQPYFDEVLNRNIMQKVAEKCYIPTNYLLYEICKTYPTSFKCSFSITNTAIEQMQNYEPLALLSFKSLIKTGNIELLAETSHHSLASQYSLKEFAKEVKLQQNMIKEIFGIRPVIFRNTELIYQNSLSKWAKKQEFEAVLTEGVTRLLGEDSPNFIYHSPITNLPLFLKNYTLSDDIAFRFSDKSWTEYPLNANTYYDKLVKQAQNSEVINLFMDYETFGEHQARSSGIFEFLFELIKKIAESDRLYLSTPSEIVKKHKQNTPTTERIYDVKTPISWADEQRDLSAWCGNHTQKDALNKIFSLEKKVIASQNQTLIDTWRKLLTSDHFYYMSTKALQDGNVHDYFSPYSSPFDAYITFMNVVKDFELLLDSKD